MRKLSLLLIIVLIVAFTTGVFAQRLAILKPTNPGQTSEAIPIDKKIYQKLLKNDLTVKDFKIFESSHLGIVDTTGYIGSAFPYNSNWGIQAGDTNSAYYNPPAACYIKAIGIVGQAWSTSPLAPGYNLLINKPAHPWVFPHEKWAGDACYTKDSLGYATLLGEEMWGSGGFPVTIVDGQRVWTEMIFLGFEPDNQKEPFVVSVVPYGEETNYMGTDASSAYGSDPVDDSPRLAKYYHLGRSGHPAQFVIRHYTVTWVVVVEYYENTRPSIELYSYGSVLNNNPKEIKCKITDLDANNPANAGVATAKLFYKVNNGSFNELAMSLVSGAKDNGEWAATLPAGYMNPGDRLTYYVEATDIPGLTTTSSEASFGYFSKKADLLVFYNDATYAPATIMPYYSNRWVNENGVKWPFDVWDGVADGALSGDLVNMYNYMVQIDGYSPVTMNDDVMGAWFAAGNKNLFWSSQEWGYNLTGGVDSTFAADDWHNKFMGIQTIGPHDINGSNGQVQFPIKPIANDPISGPLATFLGDSLFLYYYPYYELGFNNWIDAMTAGPGAVVCFVDSAQGRTTGVHKEIEGSKTVFLTFDQLCMDTKPSYYWPEYEPALSVSVVAQALKWFGLSTAVDEGTNPVLALNYELSQNYPNPFNPETRISYTISKPSDVKLSIYNVLGQKVAELVNAKQAAGKYQVTWNAKDVSSGVYFYRLEAGDYTRTMKMMLLR